MPRSKRIRWTMLIVANVLLVCLLSFYRPTTAAPPATNSEPFANSVEQRAEIIKQLQEVNSQLKEQNAMFCAALKALVADK